MNLFDFYRARSIFIFLLEKFYLNYSKFIQESSDILPPNLIVNTETPVKFLLLFPLKIRFWSTVLMYVNMGGQMY